MGLDQFISMQAPAHAAINCSSSGDNTILAATPNIIYRIVSLFLICNGAVTVQFYDGASSNNVPLTGPMAFLTSSGIAVPFSPWGHFSASNGNALVLNLSSGVQVSGSITYQAKNKLH